MALFKILRGSSDNLKSTPIKDGNAYFTPDDGGFYIDYESDRIRINPVMSLEDIYTSMDEINKRFEDIEAKIATPDWAINDESNAAYIKNRTHYEEINENNETIIHKLDDKYVDEIDEDDIDTICVIDFEFE